MLLSEDSVERSNFSQGDYHFESAVIRYRVTQTQGRAVPQLTISRSIIQEVMQGGLPVLLSDGQIDPRFSTSHGVMHSYSIGHVHSAGNCTPHSWFALCG
jgi:hypothetical protein